MKSFITVAVLSVLMYPSSGWAAQAMAVTATGYYSFTDLGATLNLRVSDEVTLVCKTPNDGKSVVLATKHYRSSHAYGLDSDSQILYRSTIPGQKIAIGVGNIPNASTLTDNFSGASGWAP